MSSSESSKSSSEDGLVKKKYNKFYEDHPEKLTEKIVCPECGVKYKYNNKTRHYNTQKHKYIVDAIALGKLKTETKSSQVC